MKRFIIYITLLVAIVIASMYVLDIIYTSAFRNGIPRSKVQYIVQEKNTTYDFVFLGSSRTEFHIDCELIEKLTGKSCVNYGILGTTMIDTFALLELMEAQGITIKNAFVQVDFLYNDVGFSPSFKAQMLPYKNNPGIQEILKNYNLDFCENHIPFYRYMENDHVIGFREFFNLSIRKGSKVDFTNGFIPKFGKGRDINRVLPSKIIDRNQSIEAMKKHFKEKGINAYFFTAPICKTVTERSYIDKLQIKIPELHNYVSIYDDKDEYFFDCGHLNFKGAEDFTSYLMNDLILKNN